MTKWVSGPAKDVKGGGHVKGTSLLVQLLKSTCNAGNVGLIPGWGTMIPAPEKLKDPDTIKTEAVKCF